MKKVRANDDQAFYSATSPSTFAALPSKDAHTAALGEGMRTWHQRLQ